MHPLTWIAGGGLAAAGIALLIDALTEDDTGTKSGGLLTHEGTLQVRWADVPFHDRAGSKERPVVIVQDTADGYHVLACTSKDKTGCAGFVTLGSGSTSTFDRKARPSWVDCRTLIAISDTAIRHPTTLGRISEAEAKRCLATLTEFDTTL